MAGMVVSILNITDAPDAKKPPTRLAIYTTHLDPGEELKLPAHMVDARLRKLESDGYCAIGQVPSWYEASKRRRQGVKALSVAELEKLVVKPKPAPAPTGGTVLEAKPMPKAKVKAPEEKLAPDKK
jgi:hypothetical protein